MAARRQAAFEAQLKENAFLKATIKPIVDDTVTFKPPIPYAIREVKRSMDKGIYFKNKARMAWVEFLELRTQRCCTSMATGISGLSCLLGTCRA